MKTKLTVSSGHDWIARYFWASIAVLILGWGGVRSCYSHGMQGWREYQSSRKVAAASAASWEGDLPPKPEGYVTDLTGVIDSERASALNERLAAFERETSTQIVEGVEASMFGASLRSFSINAIGFLLVISGIAIGVFICASILVLLEKAYGTGPGFSGGG